MNNKIQLIQKKLRNRIISISRSQLARRLIYYYRKRKAHSVDLARANEFKSIYNNRVFGTQIADIRYFLRVAKVLGLETKDIYLSCQERSANAYLQSLAEMMFNITYSNIAFDEDIKAHVNYFPFSFYFTPDGGHRELNTFEHIECRFDIFIDLLANEKRISAIYKKIGITKNFVVVNNRDSYFDINYKSIFSEERNNNDSDFNTLCGAIQFFLDRDLDVLRNGHYDVTTPLSPYLELTSLSQEEREMADIHIYRDALFIFGGGTGCNNLASLCGTPHLLHNVSLKGNISESTLTLPKYLWDASQQRLVNYCTDDFLSKNIFAGSMNLNGVWDVLKNKLTPLIYNEKAFSQYGYYYKDNTEDEIARAAERFYALIVDGLDFSNYELNLDAKFKSLLPQSHPLKYSNTVIFSEYLERHMGNVS
ncbi:MAG: hypothetical protein CL398_02065 [Acidiferrobacteraceae bacterium]|nr:hypothetical protein [Acidiferrobacteraceae bacterium]